MDKQKNCLGEMMEPKVIVKLSHLRNGELYSVSTTVGEKVLDDALLRSFISFGLLAVPFGYTLFDPKKVVTAYTNGTYRPEADLRPTRAEINKFVTLGPIQHNFLYLDVGRWGGDRIRDEGQRTFGVVWKEWAALCEYLSFDKSGVIDPNEIPQIQDKDGKPLGGNNGINEFLRSASLGGARIKLVRHGCSATPMQFYNENFHGSSKVVLNDNPVYVIIGDLHLPIVSKNITKQEIEKLDQNGNGDGLEGNGRLGPGGKYSILPDLKKPNYTSLSTNIYGYPSTHLSKWRERYIEGDIFSCYGSPGGNELAEKDLYDFITVLNSVQLPGRSVHLVQVGDMYDLWIGLGRFFKEDPNKVIPENCTISYDGEDNHVVTPKEFIDCWVNNTNKNFPKIQKAFDQFQGVKTFLYGNHDNYLSLQNGYDQRTSIKQRDKDIRKNGLFIEHGHRGDEKNRDGAIDGHKFTQDVHYLKGLRKADPDQRGSFITVPALSFVKNPNFCVYVMGHTHSPYITEVGIELRLVANQ